MDPEIEQMQKPNPNLSRRKFLWAGGLTAAAALFAGLFVRKEWKEGSNEVLEDWEEAHRYTSAEDFLEKNQSWLKNVEMAGNVSVESLDWTYRPDRPEHYGEKMPTPKETVAKLKEMGITSVRFPIRLSETIERTEYDTETEKLPFNISIDKYKPWLTELAKNDIKVTLNIGAKTMRWPEFHVGDELVDYLYEKTPSNGHVFGPDEPMGDFLLNTYYPKICKQLKDLAKKKNFPEGSYSVIQPENEANYKFGERKWAFNKEYSLKAIQIAHQHFPEAKILQNGPPFNFARTNNTLLEAELQDKSLLNKLISGLNYYYRMPHPDIASVKVNGERIFDNFMIAGLGDSLRKLFKKSFEDQVDFLRKHGIGLMISELQMEPWGNYTQPGSNFHEFIYTLLRVKRYLKLSPDSPLTQIMIWGFEEYMFNLGKNWTGKKGWHHKEIEKTIKGVNLVR